MRGADDMNLMCVFIHLVYSDASSTSKEKAMWGIMFFVVLFLIGVFTCTGGEEEK